MLSTIPEKSSHEKFTESQWQAIHLSGNNILVSASAGSGKTTVLTRRIIEKLKQGIRIDELLVCTFTDAATLEMKERIEATIKDEITKQTNENENTSAKNSKLVEHLQEQLTLLPQAHISTIHGFCSKLIAQHFEQIHIDPVFRMLTDDTEIMMLKENVYHQLAEKNFDNPDFIQLAKSYSSKRTDEKLSQLIMQLYDFSRANSQPEQWLNELACLYEVSDVTNSVVFQDLIKPIVVNQLESIVETIKRAISLLNGEIILTKLTELLEREKQFYQCFLNMVKENTPYQMVYQYVSDFQFERMIGKIKDSEDYQNDIEMAKKLRDEAKKQVRTVIDAVYCTSEEKQLERLRLTFPVVKTLARAVQQFAQLYSQEKQADNLVDYSDLEHYALNILKPLQHDGTRQLSSVAEYYQQHFHEIMVDEYQDVNRLQESIIQAVSNGKNVFMVGDVKQSIYAFRLADPNLFLEKYEAYAKENTDGVRIILKENFRSRESVIQGTNFIFQQLMDHRLSGMDYDDDALLVQGNTSFPEEDKIDISVLVYESDVAVEDDLSLTLDTATEGEIHMVARKIKQLFSENMLITEKETQRPIQFKDIVLLAPTKKNNVHIKEILEQYNIPVIIQESDTYFKRTEIMIMIALLRLIDNPYQDIPLAAVLRSPLVNLNDSQLAAIRINNRTSDYYRAMLSFVDNYRVGGIEHNAFNEALYEKLVHFMEQLTHWRNMANKESIVSLIWDIYDKTLFLDYVCGLPGGKQRQANLHALYDTAKTYETTRFKGLFQFVQFIEKMQARQQDIAQVPILSGDEDAVRVMTIHASKGLEFPVVFVLDLAKQFNLQDIKGDTIFTEKYGLGTYHFDVVNKWKYPTLVYTGIKWFKQRKLLAEELRKLYVALTRAKEKLILVGRTKNKQHFFEQQAYLLDYPEVFLPQVKRESISVTAFDWITMALFRHKDAQNDYLPNAYIPTSLQNHLARFSYEFCSLEDFEDTEKVVMNTKSNTVQNIERTYVQTHTHLLGEYTFAPDTKTTSYQSVSELKRLVEDPVVRELTQANETYRYVTDNFVTPKFMQQQSEVTPALVGTATHLLLQTLDLSHEPTMATIKQHLNELVAQGVLEKKVAQKVNVMNVLRFFQTSFGQQLRRYADKVRVEVPFSLIVTGKLLFEQLQADDSEVLIHGIVDGYFETPDGLILYDYKTDYVGYDVETVVSRYRTQLNTYAKALAVSTNQNVLHAYIVLLSSGDVIDVLDKDNDK